MRYLSASVAVVALFTLAACDKTPSVHDDLAADLASVSASNDLALAPNSASRATVSTVEQLSLPPVPALSRRAVTPHRAPHPDRRVRDVARVDAQVAEVAPQDLSSATAAASAPLVIAPRPRPVAVSVVNSGVTGVMGNDLPGGNGAVIIRGGVADGDHCDPRARRRLVSHTL